MGHCGRTDGDQIHINHGRCRTMRRVAASAVVPSEQSRNHATLTLRLLLNFPVTENKNEDRPHLPAVFSFDILNCTYGPRHAEHAARKFASSTALITTRADRSFDRGP